MRTGRRKNLSRTPSRILADSRDGDTRYGLVAEFELSAIAVFLGTCANLSSDQCPLMGSGNVDAVEWTSNGKAKQGTSMWILYCLFRYCILYDIDISSCARRSGRNVTPDSLSRGGDAEVSTLSQRCDLARIAPPRWWADPIML